MSHAGAGSGVASLDISDEEKETPPQPSSRPGWRDFLTWVDERKQSND